MSYFDNQTKIYLNLGLKINYLPQLRAYIDLLWKSNEELNLISRKMEFSELINNHLIDCMLPLPYFPKGISKVADFGSGGGLPGVIYAIQFPEIQFHLYEKSIKKQIFLKNCKEIAPNIEVHGEIPRDLGGKIDLIIARGFKPIDVILEISRNYYQQGGKYFLLKARREKIEEELAMAKKKFKDLRIELQPLQSPVLEVERNLVFIQKS